MTKNLIKELICIKDKETPLFLPNSTIVRDKKWFVCAIREDCGCLDIFDERDYIKKTVEYFRDSEYFISALFSFNLDDINITKIKVKSINIYDNIQNSIDPSLKEQYYESFALTDNMQNFLILHSHGDDITFICGTEDFLNYQLDTDDIGNFMKNYYKCIKEYADFCKPFPWEKFAIKGTGYF